MVAVNGYEVWLNGALHNAFDVSGQARKCFAGVCRLAQDPGNLDFAKRETVTIKLTARDTRGEVTVLDTFETPGIAV